MVWAKPGKTRVARLAARAKATVMMLRRTVLLSCCGAVLAAACSAKDQSTLAETRGGQSGTEGHDLIECVLGPAIPVSADEVLPDLGVTLQQLAANLATPLPGRWLAGGTAELSLELDASSGTVAQGGHVDCVPELVAELHVRSSDGALDATVPARLLRGNYAPEIASVEAALPALPPALLAPARDEDVAAVQWLMYGAGEATGPTLRVSVYFEPTMGGALIYDPEGPRGVWLKDPANLP